MTDIEKTLSALEKHGFVSVYAKDAQEAKDYVLSVIKDNETVGAGGSVTLSETGILDALLERGNQIISSVEAKKHGKDKMAARYAGMNADIYLSSSNAVTMQGDLINIDGIGNRVAAMFFGPDKVIIVAGKNKITKNPHTAIARIKKIACPQNARRLKLDTPCGLTGVCTDCDHPDRMCNVTVRIQRPPKGKAIHVVLIDGDFGY